MANYIANLPPTVVRINQPQIDRFHLLVTQVAELIDDASHIDHDLAKAALIYVGNRLADRIRYTTEQAKLDLQHAQRAAHCNIITEVNRLALSGDHQAMAEVVVAMQAPNWEPQSSDELLLAEFIDHLKNRQVVDGESIYMDYEQCLQTCEQSVCNYQSKVYAISPVAA